MPGKGPHNLPQDWETVTIYGKGTNIDKQNKRQGNTETKAKYDNSYSSTQRKLEQATDIVKPKLINPKIKKAILTARNAKKLTQKELANRVQVQPNIIQQYESGTIKADIKVLHSMERVLGIKLSGKEYGAINI